MIRVRELRHFGRQLTQLVHRVLAHAGLRVVAIVVRAGLCGLRFHLDIALHVVEVESGSENRVLGIVLFRHFRSPHCSDTQCVEGSK